MYSFDKTKIAGEAPLLCLFSAAFAVMTLVTHSFIIPTYGTILQRRAALDHYRSIISSESGYQLLENEITVKIDTLRSRLAPMPEQKKLTADPGSYLELLIAIARTSDVRFARIQPQEEQIGTDLIRYPVMLALTTTYHELGQFVSALEKIPYLFSVDRLAVTTSKNGKCNVKLLVTCRIPKERSDD